jgi:hypothetical protein
MEKKITKRDNYNYLMMLVDAAQSEGMIKEEGAYERLVQFINHELELMDKRTEKAKTYAKNKSAKAGDELADMALEALKEIGEVATIADIVEVINKNHENAGATSGKLAYRLNKLVEAGLAEKSDVVIKEEGKGSRKVNGYKAIVEVEVEE